MAGTSSTRLTRAAAMTAIALLGPANPSIADETVTINFPRGLACAFPLQVDITFSEHRVMRTFTDRNGNVVRILSAGKGDTLLFTNVDTGETILLQPNGAVERDTLNADGSVTSVITGHNVLILFPTDVPAGPSTTQYVGRVVFTVDTNGTFTLQSVSGISTDICAALE